MKATLSMKAHVSIQLELTALAEMCERTGDDLRALIDISPAIRVVLDAFCTRYPADAHWVRGAIRRRETMLDMLDRQEALNARIAA